MFKKKTIRADSLVGTDGIHFRDSLSAIDW